MNLNINSPSGANQEAFPTVAAMQNSPTAKSKNRLWAFCGNACLKVKRGNKVSPLQIMSDIDSADPQPGPTGLEPAALRDQTDSLPGPSIVKPANCDADSAGPEHAEERQAKGKKNCLWAFFKNTCLAVKSKLRGNTVSSLQPMSDTVSADPQPGPSGLKPTNCDTADPEPAEEKQTKKKKKGICKFFKKWWRAVKDLDVHEITALQEPTDLQLDLSTLEPKALQDSSDPPEDPQPAQSDHDGDPAASVVTPVVGPCSLVLTGLQDPADPLPGPSVPEPPRKCTGGSKQRRVEDKTWFRTTSCPGPSTLPFSEVYEVGEEIGAGGFGRVYKGIWKYTGEQVAIKFLPKYETYDQFISLPGCSKPLLAEVALNLLLNEPPVSPYIVHMVDWFEEKYRYILILEYPQPCKDLKRFVVSNILQINESLASDLIYQAVLGAKHSFDRGVFHRDIKLNNFLINTTTNQVKLIDFGIGDLVKSSYFGEFRGLCRPPEFYTCLKYEAEPTTVWSLGELMYRMVCYRTPFESVRDMRTPGTLKFNSRVSRECQDLISRCLTCDPTKRATIEEILQHEWFQRGQMSRVAQESHSAT